MRLPGDREERLVCSEILLHPIVFPRKEKANPFPSLLHSPWLSLTMQGFTTTPKTKFKQSENGNGTLESTLMATKKHRKGWITETEPGVQLIHALTPSFLLSFWSFPRLSTSAHGQNLTHTHRFSLLQCRHPPPLPHLPAPGRCQLWGWEVPSPKLAPWKLSAASCSHRHPSASGN